MKLVDQTWELFKKEIVLEWRSKYAFNGVLLYVVSTVFICFTIIPFFMSRHAPNAIKVVNATGISSGKMLMASVSAFNKLSSKLCD